MRSTDAVELSRALSERGDAYLDALLTGTLRDIESGVAACPRKRSERGVRPGEAAARRDRRPRVSRLREARRRAAHAADQRLAVRNLARGDVRIVRRWREGGTGSADHDEDPRHRDRQECGERSHHSGADRDPASSIMASASRKRIASCRSPSEEARRLGVTPWILDKARLLYGLATQLGSPDDDITRLITHYERWANVEVTSGRHDAASDALP